MLRDLASTIQHVQAMDTQNTAYYYAANIVLEEEDRDLILPCLPQTCPWTHITGWQ